MTSFKELQVRDSRRTAVSMASFCFLAAFAVLAFWATNDVGGPTYSILAVATIAICSVAIAFARLEGRIDVLSPAAIFGIVWCIMYGVRPLYMAANGDTSLRGRYNFPQFLAEAMWLAVLAATVFFLCYLWTWRRPRKLGVFSTGAIRFVPTLMLGILGAFAAVAGYQERLGGPTAYVYYLPLVLVPVTLVLFHDVINEQARLSRIVPCLAFALIFCVRYALTGQRAFLLFMLVGIGAYLYVGKKGGAPRFTTAAILGAIVIVFVINGLEISRDQRRGIQYGGTENAGSVSQRVFLGGTTEMLPAMSTLLALEGNAWTQQPGRTLGVTIVHWVPSRLWPEKPKTYDELLYAQLFPEHYAVDKANTQFSIIGDFYTDSGPPGVVVGFASLGILTAFLYRRVRYSSHLRWRMVYAMFPVLFMTLLRGNIALNLGIALFLIAPIYLLTTKSVRMDPAQAADSR